MKVAVVHDWLTGMRGGEAVLEAVLELFPDADLYTLLHNRGSVSARIEDRRVITSFVDRLPFKATKYRWYLPLFPTAIELFDFHGYDLIVSSSHCVARGVLPPPGVPHLCYFHSPMRYVWDMYHDYFPAKGLANRFVIPFFANYLRMWDSAARDRVDTHVCNSAFVAERIRRYYGREAVVIPPPCLNETEAKSITLPPPNTREDFYLVVSAFVPYKRIDLAVAACLNEGRRLVVVGKGPEEKRLRRLAGESDLIDFRGGVTRSEIEDLYARANALLFPGEEDFGIVPVEAQARGCPVIAYESGGALETVIAGKTGVFFDEQSAEALGTAMRRHEDQRSKYRPADFRRNAAAFTKESFQRKMRAEIDALLKEYAARKGRRSAPRGVKGSGKAR